MWDMPDGAKRLVGRKGGRAPLNPWVGSGDSEALGRNVLQYA